MRENQFDSFSCSLLLPANKIDRIANVATKNPLAKKTRKRERQTLHTLQHSKESERERKRDGDKKKEKADTYIYQHP